VHPELRDRGVASLLWWDSEEAWAGGSKGQEDGGLSARDGMLEQAQHIRDHSGLSVCGNLVSDRFPRRTSHSALHEGG
jgi:hypothetical protein